MNPLGEQSPRTEHFAQCLSRLCSEGWVSFHESQAREHRGLSLDGALDDWHSNLRFWKRKHRDSSLWGWGIRRPPAFGGGERVVCLQVQGAAHLWGGRS